MLIYWLPLHFEHNSNRLQSKPQFRSLWGPCRPKENLQLSKTKDVTNTLFSYPTGNGDKGCRHPPVRRTNYGLLLKRSVKHLLEHSKRICDCKLTIKCFLFSFFGVRFKKGVKETFNFWIFLIKKKNAKLYATANIKQFLNQHLN